MYRRRFLAAVSAAAAATAGCQGRSGSSSDVGRSDTAVPGTWPSAAKTAANSRYASESSVSEEPTVAWRATVGSVDRFPPLVTEERVFVLAREALIAFDRDGAEQWSLSLGDGEFVHGAPTAVPRGNWVGVGTGDGRVRLLAAADGRVRFDRTFASGVDHAPPSANGLSSGRRRASRRSTTRAMDGGVADCRLRSSPRRRSSTTWHSSGRTRTSSTRSTSRPASTAGDGPSSRTRTRASQSRGSRRRRTGRTSRIRGPFTRCRSATAGDCGDPHDWERSFGPPVRVDGAVLVTDGDGVSAFGPAGGPGFGSLRPTPLRWRFVPGGSPSGLAVAGDRAYLTVAREGEDELLELR